MAEAQKRPSLDLATLLMQNGVDEVLGEDPAAPGTVLVKIGDQEKRLNTEKYLKKSGIDPTQINVELGSAESPLDDNALSFGEQALIAQAANTREQFKYLQKQYGADNVRPRRDEAGELQGFSLKKGNTWKKAELGFWAELLGKEGGTIAGAIAGAETGSIAGAGAGSLVIPGIGTIGGGVIGGILGAGIGAMTGRGLTIANAKRMGIRTELDAEEVAAELSKEFMYGMAGEGASKAVVKGGAAAIDLFKQGVKKAATLGVALKVPVAKTAAGLAGVDAVDMLTWQDLPDLVASKAKRLNKFATETGLREANPIITETSENLVNNLSQAKDSLYGQYDEATKHVLPKLESARIDMSDVASGFTKKLQQYGLVDDAGKWVAADKREITEFLTAKNINALKRSYAAIKSAQAPALASGGSEAPITMGFKDAQRLVRNVDELLEAGGAYSKGDAEVTSRVIGDMRVLRNAGHSKLMNELAKHDEGAAKAWDALNKKYSSARALLDDLGPLTRTTKVDQFMSNVTNPEYNNTSIKAINELIDRTGGNSKALMDDLFSTKAAMSTSKLFSAKYGAMRAMIGQPVAAIQGRTIHKLTTAAHTVNYLNQLNPAQRAAFMKNPSAMENLLRGITQSQALYDATQDNLNQKIQGVVNEQQ